MKDALPEAATVALFSLGLLGFLANGYVTVGECANPDGQGQIICEWNGGSHGDGKGESFVKIGPLTLTR